LGLFKRLDHDRLCARSGAGVRRSVLAVLVAGIDPTEQSAALRVVGAGVAEPQKVAVRPALALPVLDGLVGDVVDSRFGVPLGDRCAQTPRPAAKLLDITDKKKEHRAGATDSGDRCLGSLAGGGGL